MKNILVCLICLIVLISCATRKKHYIIGVSQCSEDIWRDKLNDEIRISSYSYDKVKFRFASADDNDKRQIEQINKFIDDGVDLLIAAPNQLHTISSAINRAYDKGIPVILFDRKTDSNKYTAFIGADNYEIGRVMGEFIAKRLGGHGNVAEIAGLKSSSPAIDRHKGFMDALKVYPDIHIVATRNGNWTGESGKAGMESILSQRQDIDCVFGQNDRMAIGARQTVSAHNIKRNILYVGIDGLPTPDGGLSSVKEKKLAASYIYPTRGDLVVKLAMNILEKKPYERENHLMATIVTSENASAMLMQVDEMNQQRKNLIQMHGKINEYLAQYNHQQIYLVLSAVILLLLICFFSYIYRTILMRRRMEKEATNAKLQFFTNVSHEFRTPLTLIADPIERLLDDKYVTDSQRSLLQIAQKNVKVMLQLIRQILDFRKVQNGKMTVELDTFNMAEYVRQWFSGFLPLAATKDINLTLSAPQQLMMRTDMKKLECICYNLLSNAVKYTPKGGNIAMSVKEADMQVIISVKDDGIGIPKEKLPHVFDRFYQVHNNNNVDGTGIGLSLVKAFVDIVKGSITVDSEETNGTVFTVVLPIGDIENTTESAPVMSSDRPEFVIAEDNKKEDTDLQRMTSPDTEGDKPTILVVDDNDDVRSYIISLLKGSFEVKEASDGKQGLEKAIHDVPDLIICDVMMPVMDGLEMCDRIKKETVTSHIPVIMLTARTQEDQRAEGYDYGADAYITKPFSGKVLIARVKNLLANRRLLRDIFSNGELIDNKSTDADTIFINEFRKQVQTQLSDSELNVETLSADMGMSRVQLYRKVKALTGASPVELIRITRLKRAERLLKTGGKTIAEVSYEVGFSSPSYFSKCYKDYFGMLPGETL